MNKRLRLILILFLVSVDFYAQVGIGTQNPDPSTELEITSTDKGVLLPRVVLKSATIFNLANNSKTESLLVYNIGENLEKGFYYWSNNKWNLLIDEKHVGNLTAEENKGINIADKKISAKTDEALWNANKLQDKEIEKSELKGDEILKYDKTKGKWTAAAETIVAAGWGLEGNKDTTNKNFIGTTDSKPLVFKTSGTDRMIIDGSSQKVTFPKEEKEGKYIQLYNSSGGRPTIELSNKGNKFDIWMKEGEGRINTEGNLPLYLGINDNDINIGISKDGKVGINTAEPKAQLDVKGNVHIEDLKGDKVEGDQVVMVGVDGILKKGALPSETVVPKTTSFLTGEGEPNKTNGKDGDVYLDESTSYLYKKDGGEWKRKKLLKGDRGSDGDRGSSGRDGRDGSSGTYLPKGTIVAWYGGSIPSGWAKCDGSNGTPDLEGRFVLGASNSSGGSNGRYYISEGKYGGEAEVTLTVDQMPRHHHGQEGFRYDRQDWKGGGEKANGYTIFKENKETWNEGGGKSHPNIPPYLALYYIMKL